MHLPDPALTLTIPSIHDRTVLDCRIYHPLGLEDTLLAPTSASEASWRPKNAAIIAHPYAPLGGSYDDPIVEEVAGHLLAKGFIVGTFNFRGAGHSAGRTSWTSRPERDDYTSFIGFLVYYIHHIDPPPPSSPAAGAAPILIMGGYSYGAMITTQLPPLPAVLAAFASPAAASDAAHIRLRAETLAHQQRELLLMSTSLAVGGAGARARGRDRRSLRVGQGGGSLSSHAGRKSHESRRSFSIDEAEEKLRKGVQEFIARTRQLSPGGSRGRNRGFSAPDPPASSTASAAAPASTSTLPPIESLVRPRPAYILVAPLQGIITSLATMSRSLTSADPSAEAKLWQNPTLAVFGNQDVFVSARKLRDWTARMEGGGNGTTSSESDTEGTVSRFEGREVDGAGHFWIEEGVLGQMMGWVDQFVRGLTSDG